MFATVQPEFSFGCTTKMLSFNNKIFFRVNNAYVTISNYIGPYVHTYVIIRITDR
jgi:hypothetical protein